MRAGVYYNNNKVIVEEMPKPVINENEILIRVEACGICGSDIMEWYRIKKAPLVLGHELCGEVVEAGSQVTKFKKWDRVFSTHHVPCDTCPYCLRGHHTACSMFQNVNNHTPGGFSEYLKVSGRSLKTGTFVLPEEMSYEEGTFIEPLGTAVRCLRTAELKPGDTVLILGSGIIGLLIIKLARAMGAGRIIATDLSQERLQAARTFGAENVIGADQDIPAEIKKICGGSLADKVILCTGALSAARQALGSADKGGIITFFAVPNPGQELSVDFNPFWRNDITIKTCYGAAPVDNIQALELIRSKALNVKEMITHTFPLKDIGQGFKMAAQGAGCLKVLIYPHG